MSNKFSNNLYILTFWVFLLITLAMFCSCQQPQQTIARPTEGVKFTDIKPMYKNFDPYPAEISAEIIVTKISIPAKNYDKIKDIWYNSDLNRFGYENRQIFIDNGFRLRSIQPQIWNILRQRLIAIGADISQRAALIIDCSKSSSFTVKRLIQQDDYFYSSPFEQFEKYQAAQGNVQLEISALPSPKSDDSVVISIVPVLEPFEIKDVDKFTQFRFQFIADTGYTVLFGVNNFDIQTNQLKNLFFYNRTKIPTVDLFLISCSKIF